MKKILFLIIILAFSFSSYAQLDRSKPPVPGPAPKFEIGSYESFTLKNGMKVFVVEDHKLPTVTVRLLLDVDPVLEGDKVGYLSMVGALMQAGTKNRTKDQINEQIDFLGASLFFSSKGFSGSCLKKNLDKMLDIASDILYNPVFPDEELAKQKKQYISGLSAQKSSPSFIASNLIKTFVYGKNHPYGEIETEQTIENIDMPVIKKYYNTYYKPNVAYLVFVGDINLKEAKKLAKKYFAKWKKGDVPKHHYDVPALPNGTQVVYSPRKSAVQSTIKIVYPLDYKPGNPDVIKASVMNEILGGGLFSARLFKNLREDKAYTYGAYSSLSTDEVTGDFSAGAEVRGSVTDSAIVEFLKEMKRIVDEPVTKDELSLTKNVLTGRFALRLERPQTVATFALNTARYNLPADYYKTYMQKIDKVTIADVQAMAKKYIKPDNAYIIVVGPEGLEDRLKKFDADGKIDVVDEYGKPIDLTLKKAPADMTAEKVLNNYIDAIGGKQKLDEVKTLVVDATMDMGMMSINITEKIKRPDKYLSVTKMGGREFSKTILNGQKGLVFMQGQKRDMPEEQLKGMQSKFYINDVNYYLTNNKGLELLGIEKVKGEDTYKVKIIDEQGNEVLENYSVKTGLKVKSFKTISQNGQVFEITSWYNNYKDFDGIKFATEIKMEGAQNMTINFTDIKLNQELDDSEFKVE